MIDPRTIQTFLKTEGYYTGVIDGVFGPVSYSASRAALRAANVNAGQWLNDRVYVAITQLFLNKINAAGLIVDGLAGQRTNDAIYVYTTTLLHTITNTWPRQADVRAGTSMFGKPGRDQAMVTLPPGYVMWGDYNRKIRVREFQAHAKVVDSMQRIFQRVLDQYGPTQIKKLNLDIFSGCYNYRQVVGGTGSLSMHSWGIAIDIDSDHNQMDEGSGEAAFSKPVYAPFIDAWEAEGWVNLGRARNYDWMHFQASRL
jgi:hypothetical protein